jgi:hypothetical protein
MKGKTMQRRSRLLSVLLVLAMAPLFFVAAPAAADNPSVSIAVVDGQGAAVNAVTTDAATGWPKPNPLIVNVTLNCSGNTDCNLNFSLNIVSGASSTGSIRFYLYDGPSLLSCERMCGRCSG